MVLEGRVVVMEAMMGIINGNSNSNGNGMNKNKNMNNINNLLLLSNNL